MLLPIIGITAFAQESNSPIPEDKILELPYCPPGETIKIPVGDAEYIDNGSGNLIKISDLLTFETQLDADNWKNAMLADLENLTQYNPIIDLSSITRATHGDAIVASRKVGMGTIKLGIIYTTSLDGHMGVITHHEAYTQLTGYTLGVEWDEDVCYSEIDPEGKDIYAIAKGTLIHYFLVDGLIELGRVPVTLEGSCMAIR